MAVVLSEQTIYLQVELDQMHYFAGSVVAAYPQAYLLYVEQAPFVTQPAPVVVHPDKANEQAISVVYVFDNKAHVRLTHEVPFHPHTGANPVEKTLLQS